MQLFTSNTKTCTVILCTFLFNAFFLNSIFAEGTPQLTPTNTDTISLFINSNHYDNFADPVDLLRFTAKSEDCKAILDWIRAEEENFSHYKIERSVNGRNFEKIAELESKGSASGFHYHFTDDNAMAINYYRLKMIDQDGSFKYSNTQIVVTDCSDSNISIYPNPLESQHFINVKFSNIQENVSISIFDVAGKRLKVISFEANTDQTILDIADLVPGTYLIHFYYAGKREAIKLVKV